jgi:uncharacterized protein YutE (UPF0331/DUF86 family)
MAITYPRCDLSSSRPFVEIPMENEFNGIEKRLDELNERLARLEPLRGRPRSEFDADPYLRDIVERNLEISAQCCIDICHRIIILENARKPASYFEAVLLMGELGILTPDFARRLAPLTGFRNVLIHEYLSIDWDQVYQKLQNLDDLRSFAEEIRVWLATRHDSY